MDIEKEKKTFTAEEVIKLQTEVLNGLKKIVKMFPKDSDHIQKCTKK